MSQFWLTGEPTDGQQTGGTVGAGIDFFDLLNDPTEWEGISPETSVLQIYEAFVQTVPIEQQESFYAWAAEKHVPLSFNTGVTTLDDPDVLQYITQFVSLGGTVSYLTMDEPLYIESEDPAYAQVSVQELAENVAASIAQIKALAPDLIVVDQEPVPVTPPAELAEWCLAYEKAVGTPLGGMQLDVDWNYGTETWEPALLAAVSTLEAVGVPPGIIIDSEEPTDMAWTDYAINTYIICRALFGEAISTYDFQTWDPNPTYLLPDIAPGSLSDVEYAAGFYDQVSSAYQSVLGRAPTQSEYFSAMRALASGLESLTTISANLHTYGMAVPETALYEDTTATISMGSSSVITISSNDEAVVAGTSATTIMCPIQDANDDIVGYSPVTTIVEFTGAGTINPGWAFETLATSGPIQLGDLTDNVTLRLSSNETLTLDPSRDFIVQLDGTNDVINVSGTATLNLSIIQQGIEESYSAAPSFDIEAGDNGIRSENEFIGQGQSTLDLYGSVTGYVTLDTLSDTLSIPGLPADTMTGFASFNLGNDDRFVVGAGNYTVACTSGPDILVYKPDAGNVTLENVTSSDVLLAFQNFGSLLNGAALVADATTHDGNTFIDVPGAGTIELADYVGAIPLDDAGVACYCVGTRIATPGGELPIEDLRIGDSVLTAQGQHRPIRWIGRRSYAKRLLTGEVRPILIRSGALGHDVPHRDLRVSPCHALFLEGVLVPARLLVNGSSILVDTELNDLHYFHVELDSHDVLLAEGAPSESFIDHESRNTFQNAAEFFARYGGIPPVEECAPRIEHGDSLAALRCRLAARAGLAADHVDDAACHGPLDGRIDVGEHSLIGGWAYDATRPHTPVRLEICIDGIPIANCVANRFRHDLREAGKGEGYCAFEHHFLEPLSAAVHFIQVRRCEDGAVLGEVLLHADPAEPGLLDGRIDHSSAATIEGWALDFRHPTIPVRLEVLEDDRVIGQTVANRFRADLANACLRDGNCSFVFRFNKAPNDLRRMRVRRASDGTLLPVSSAELQAA